MHIYIDESGTFSGFHTDSLSGVGMLAIPSGNLKKLTKSYNKLRPSLLNGETEVKGRTLNEAQIKDVIKLLSEHNVLFEASFLDLGLHQESEVLNYKEKHGKEMLSRVSRFNLETQPVVEAVSQYVLKASLPLYMQAITTFDVIHRTISHIPLYYVQRCPHELGEFTWVIDGKDPLKVTDWENWWSEYAPGALSTKSRTSPAISMVGANYTYYDRFRQVEDGQEGTNVKLLMKDLRFSSAAEPGLELVDILINALRRALTGKLKEEGWRNLNRLMVHRKSKYIGLILISEDGDQLFTPSYAEVINKISVGGRPMVTDRNIQKSIKSLRT